MQKDARILRLQKYIVSNYLRSRSIRASSGKNCLGHILYHGNAIRFMNEFLMPLRLKIMKSFLKKKPVTKTKWSIQCNVIEKYDHTANEFVWIARCELFRHNVLTEFIESTCSTKREANIALKKHRYFLMVRKTEYKITEKRTNPVNSKSKKGDIMVEKELPCKRGAECIWPHCAEDCDGRPAMNKRLETPFGVDDEGRLTEDAAKWLTDD